MNDKLRALIAQKQIHYPKNPYWEFKDNEIVKHQHPEESITTTLPILRVLSYAALDYFQDNYDSFQSESQVLVLTESEYQKLDSHLPEISLLNHLKFDGESLHMVVLPQQNTWSNTIISETYWHTHIAKPNITPLVRIHTHHILNAYQSTTDWSTLNSGSLEMVVGKIYDENPELAYWLDTRGTNTKDNVYHVTFVNGTKIEKIKSGNQRGINPAILKHFANQTEESNANQH